MIEPEIVEFFKQFGPLGIIAAVLLGYRGPIIGMLSRATRDPLIESLGAQNGHFEENNRLFKAMGPVLASMDATLKALLKEQEAILKEQEASLKEQQTQTRVLQEMAVDARVILDRGRR